MEGKNESNKEVLAAIAANGAAIAANSEVIAANSAAITAIAASTAANQAAIATLGKELNSKIDSVHKEISRDIADFAAVVGGEFEKVYSRLDDVESKVGRMESTMVTKDYLDEKIGEVRGDFTDMLRAEDHKVTAFVEVVADHRGMSRSDAKALLAMPPFPRQ